MSGLELSSARLVPVPGPDGWLARLPGAVVWAPDDSEAADELLAACLAAGGPIELLGRVGSRLADPHAAPWPPFAIFAARGPDLVAVVHGPAEVVADCDGAETSLFGGDDVGSWLNRVLKGARWLRSGARGEDQGRANLRDGVIRANGFVLMGGAAPGPSPQASRGPGKRRALTRWRPAYRRWPGAPGAASGARFRRANCR